MKHLLNYIFCFFSLFSLAQVGPYSWQDHLSFNWANTIAKLGDDVYASNFNGLVKVDFNDFVTDRKNKINGLSDVGIKILRTNTYNNKMMVVYENCNIDIVDLNGNVQNYPDIKLKVINGKKSINEVSFKDHYAYLACGFGIVLFDMDKLEVKETYIIGPAGTNLEVYQIALNDSLIFAATPTGLYRSNYKTKTLNNYNSWVKASPLPVGPYSGVVKVQDKILAAYSPFKLDNTIINTDTMYVLNNNTWAKYVPGGNFIRKLTYVKDKYFTIFNEFGSLVLDITTGTIFNYITSFNGQYINPSDLMFDYNKENQMSFWGTDYLHGVYQTFGYYPYYVQNPIKVNGTNRNSLSNIDAFNDKVAVSPSYPENAGGSTFSTEGVYVLKDNEWRSIKYNDVNTNTPIQDIDFVYYDRKDKTRMWAGSWFAGLLEYKNDQLVAVYNSSNTPMGEAYPGASRCTGLSMDNDGNLWFANSDSPKYISVRKKDGSFVSLNFATARFVRKLIVDRNNIVWAIHERDQGITVYKNTSFSQPQLNVNYKILGKDVNQGNLESNSVYAIAEDKDGKIWVGTTAGLRVFYNAANIFSNSNFDAQPIKIVQDGNVELLLEQETVTSICVDGANNKWVGTQNGGLYCFSPDGLKQIYHFSTDNSPLYSNEIIDIAYDKSTGDVFIGTSLGLQSFRSPIIEGEENYDNIHAFPNPVRPGYTGQVFVRGLVDNSIVKITDESGNLVWETKSQGGQIEWPVKNLSGARAASGVYIIYAATTTAELKAVSKILVVN